MIIMMDRKIKKGKKTAAAAKNREKNLELPLKLVVKAKPPTPFLFCE